MNPIIFLLEEDPITLAGLKAILTTAHFVVAGEAGSYVDYLNKMGGSLNWNVLVIGLGWEETCYKQSLRVIKDTKAKNADARILVYSAHFEPALVLEAVRSGADGFVTQRCGKEGLLQGIVHVAEGGRYFSPDLSQFIEGGSDGKPRIVPYQNLSEREFEVLILLAQGFTNARIAHKLSVKPKTVSSFRARVLEKLHLATNADLVRYAITHSLIPHDADSRQQKL